MRNLCNREVTRYKTKTDEWTWLRGERWEESTIILNKCCLNYYMQVSHLIQAPISRFSEWHHQSPRQLNQKSRSYCGLPGALLLQPMCHESVYCNWRPFQPGLVPLLHHPSPSSPHEIWIPWGPGWPACSQCLEQCMAHSRCTFKSFWMNEWSSLPSQTLLNTTIMIFPNCYYVHSALWLTILRCYSH